MNNNIYYVYAYMRSKDSETAKAGTPYYIGKGCGKRAFSSQHGKIAVPKDKSDIIFYGEYLTESEAFDMEIAYVDFYGRVDLGVGILRNATNGGDGASGYRHTEETIDILRQLNLGENNPRFGKKDSLETRNKKSVSKIGHQTGMMGKNHKEETKRHLSAVNSGENNAMFGKRHSEDTKEKQRLAKIGRIFPKVTCPHCNKHGGYPAMYRYHFNNCKLFTTPINSTSTPS